MITRIKDHEKWMKLAFREAEKAFKQDEVPVGAVVVQNRQIIGRGYNQCESLNDPTAHAEIIAITSASNTIKNWRLMDCSLYVTKEPCPMCAGALLHSRVKRVVYGAPDLKAGAAGTVLNLFESQAAYHYATVENGLLEEECRSQLQAFFKRRRKEIKAKKQAQKALENEQENKDK